MLINTGKWSENRINKMLLRASGIKSAGERIDFISGHFLETAYMDSTLPGDLKTKEDLVINFEGVDCFTFIDYIEALRISGNFSEFKGNLKKIRYRGGNIAFEKRNHFFTDWREYNSKFVYDCTKDIGGNKTLHTSKVLNEVQKGVHLLEGVAPEKRDIFYIKPDDVSARVIKKIKTGDYAGIYSKAEGLDVSHVGIIIKQNDTALLRHASSDTENRKVIDQDFRKYISGKPGLIVFRPKDLTALPTGQAGVKAGL